MRRQQSQTQRLDQQIACHRRRCLRTISAAFDHHGKSDLRIVKRRDSDKPRIDAELFFEVLPSALIPIDDRLVRLRIDRIDLSLSRPRFSACAQFAANQSAEGAGGRAALPACIELDVRRTESQVVALLRFDTPGLCAEDSDLARVRQRLAGLYRGDAALKCSEARTDPSAGRTEFMLTVPYEQPHGDRR